MQFFSSKVDDLLLLFFMLSLSKHRPPMPFHRQDKTNKAVRYGNIFKIFFVHTITEAKQYTGIGRAEPELEPGRWIFHPDHLTWRTLV